MYLRNFAYIEYLDNSLALVNRGLTDLSRDNQKLLSLNDIKYRSFDEQTSLLKSKRCQATQSSIVKSLRTMDLEAMRALPRLKEELKNCYSLIY